MSAVREESVKLREQIKTLKNKGMVLFKIICLLYDCCFFHEDLALLLMGALHMDWYLMPKHQCEGS